MDEKYLKNYYEIVDQLEKITLMQKIFLDTKKNLGKQLTLANKRELNIAVICGDNEFNEGTVTIKILEVLKVKITKHFQNQI